MSAMLNKDGTLTLYDASGKKLLRGSIAECFKHMGAESAPAPKAKKAKPQSRSQRWSDAANKAVTALEELDEMRGEFEEWKNNLPENLQQSALGEKLDAVCELDIQGALDTASEAESIDLPLGFGRD